MLILGIILTIVGFLIFQWGANALNKSFWERPLIFNNPIAVLIIYLLWIGLLIGGLVLLWKVNPIIVGIILGGYFILWVIGRFLESEKAKIKRIFRTYKQLKLFRLKATEQGILKETAQLYFRSLRWDEDKINRILKILFEEDEDKIKDIKSLTRSILIFERPSDDLVGSDIKSFFTKSTKRDKLIDEVYRKELKEETVIAKRPELSTDTLKRMQQSGVNPEELSNEQLAALESLEVPQKSHWTAKPFMYIGIMLGFLAILSLIYREWESFIFYGLISLILSYIGYRIQSHISAKRFREASIKKHAEDIKTRKK